MHIDRSCWNQICTNNLSSCGNFRCQEITTAIITFVMDVPFSLAGLPISLGKPFNWLDKNERASIKHLHFQTDINQSTSRPVVRWDDRTSWPKLNVNAFFFRKKEDRFRSRTLSLAMDGKDLRVLFFLLQISRWRPELISNWLIWNLKGFLVATFKAIRWNEKKKTWNLAMSKKR